MEASGHMKPKKLIIYAPADLVEWLAAESERTGVPVTELGRRALRMLQYTTIGEKNVAS